MLENKELTKKIEKDAAKYFENSSGCHDWTHVERVRNLALKIAKKKKANPKVVEIAALLHDIGRNNEMKNKGKFCHAERGAEIAEQILKKYSLEQNEIKNIIQCIRAHRFRNNHKPESIEAKVIFDADKLDSIGAIGVARNFLFAGNAGSGNLYTGNENKIVKSGDGMNYAFTKEDSAVLEYEIKLRHIKNKMLTKAGKYIAKKRHEYMKEFFKRFWEEVKGKA